MTPHNFIDRTGQRYGLLTVIKRLPNKNGKTMWYCKCDCGNFTDVSGDLLNSGKTKSCGCLAGRPNREKKNLIGKRFGKLTVVEYIGKIDGKHNYWKCLCDCGEYVYRPTDKLTDGTECMCEACAEKHAAERMRENAGYVGGTQISRIRTDRPIATNSSGVRGVYFDRRTGRWRARLKFKGKLMSFGSYANFEDAVKARKQAEAEYFGEFLTQYNEI